MRYEGKITPGFFRSSIVALILACFLYLFLPDVVLTLFCRERHSDTSTGLFLTLQVREPKQDSPNAKYVYSRDTLKNGKITTACLCSYRTLSFLYQKAPWVKSSKTPTDWWITVVFWVPGISVSSAPVLSWYFPLCRALLSFGSL